jgi:hypothetical protein
MHCVDQTVAVVYRWRLGGVTARGSRMLHRQTLFARSIGALLLALIVIGCGGTSKTNSEADALVVPDVLVVADASDAAEGSTTDDVTDAADATVNTDADIALDAAGDTAKDGDDAAVAVGTLILEDQVLSGSYNQILIREVALPKDFALPGKLRVYVDEGGVAGVEIGSIVVPKDKVLANQLLTLAKPIIGAHAYLAALLHDDGKPFLDDSGAPLTAGFHVQGDMVEPALVMNTQELPASDLSTLAVGMVRVPASLTVGAWLAIYADANGAPGALLGKQQFTTGETKNATLVLTSGLTKAQTLHAVLREGAAGTGSWKPSSPVLKDLAGQVVDTSLAIDSVAFHAALEIEDQVLADPKKLLVKQVTIPEAYFGGWLAIYEDNAGSPGALLGKLYTTTGTKKDQTLALTVAQQGEKTLHAVLYAGQMWDVATNVVMPAPGGGGMSMTFKIGAQSLSYILAPPYTTDNPRHVVVKRAYSYAKPAWVVLARDDNGKPGTLLAQKKILPKFAGDVHIWNLTGDFLESGTIPEYLKAVLGTFRRSARGVENLHVLLYEDSPADNKFTYTPGGTEDMPVLDANSQPVTALLAVTVKSSIQNSQQESARYYFPCPLSQHIANPTKLPVDCRCHVNVDGLDFPECKADIADGLSMHFGEGPRARTHNFGGFRSGFSEAADKELIALMVWKDDKTIWPENDLTMDVGAVMGIHMETRERRIISGRTSDTATGIVDKGTGPVLADPFEVQKGPDGKYYVASYSYVRIDASLVPTVDVIRVDPKTGNREYAWRSNHLGYNFANQTNPYGHCGNGRTDKYGYYSVQIGRKAFGIDQGGNFYLSYAHNGNTPTSDGIGILKIGADGKSCDFVTRTKVGVDNVLYKGKSIGTGVEPQAGPYKGILIKDGKLYTSTELNDELYEIDLASGDRKMLHKDGVTDTNTGSTGTHVVWDAHRNLIWQAGLSGATLMFDPAKGTSEPLWCPQNDRDYFGIACLKAAAWGNNGMPMERGIWIHPTDPEYIFVVNATMIMRVHLMSGTSEIFSY